METNLKHQSGYSLVEILVAAAIVTVSALGFGFFAYNQSKLFVAADKKLESLGAEVELLSRSTRILTDVKDAGGFNTQGLCRFIDTPAQSYGVDQVDFVFEPARIQAVFNDANWTRVLGSGWRRVSSVGGCTSSTTKACVTMAGNSPILVHMGTAGRAADQVAYAEINFTANTVYNSERLQDGVFPAIPLTGRWDAKRVGFTISVKAVFGSDPLSHRTSKSDDFVWAADSEFCHVTRAGVLVRNPATNEPIRVYVSGTGPGDPDGRRLFNFTQFSDVTAEPISISVPRTYGQKGKVVENGGQIDPLYSLELSCQEHSFRCRDRSARREFRTQLPYRFAASYAASNSVTRDPAVKFYPRLQLVDGKGGSDLLAGNSAPIRRNESVPYRVFREADGTDRIYQDIGQANLAALSFADRQKIALQITDTETLSFEIGDTTGNLCNRVCDGAQSGTNRYFAQILYQLLDARGPGNHYSSTYKSQNPVGCTVCYMKSCQGRGLETWGPVERFLAAQPEIGPQPSEPLDGVVPECVLDDTASVRNTAPFPDRSGEDGQCLAARISGNGLTYVARPCSSRLPVMCYNFGKHFLASDQASGISQVTHDQAQRRCFETGRERFNVTEFAARFAEHGLVFPTGVPNASGAADLFNVAKAGSLLAPQSADQIRDAITWVTSKQSAALSQEFWLGLRVDANGNVFADPPISQVRRQAQDEWSIYYDSAGLPHMDRLTFAQDNLVSTATSNGGLLVAHHVKFRGGIWAAKNQSRSFRFICQGKDNNRGFFISAAVSSNFADGGAICRNSSPEGFFLPPTTPLQWAQVYQLISPNDRFFAFPSPIVTREAGQVSLAWVALQQGGAASNHSFDLGDSEFSTPILNAGTMAIPIGATSPSNFLGARGQFVSNLVDDPKDLEEKNQAIRNLNGQIASKQDQLDKVIQDLQKDFKDWEAKPANPGGDPYKAPSSLTSRKADLESDIASLNQDLQREINRVVKLIPRTASHLLCKGGSLSVAKVSQGCATGSVRVRSDALEGLVSQIEFIFASMNLAEGSSIWIGAGNP